MLQRVQGQYGKTLVSGDHSLLEQGKETDIFVVLCLIYMQSYDSINQALQCLFVPSRQEADLHDTPTLLIMSCKQRIDGVVIEAFIFLFLLTFFDFYCNNEMTIN